MSFELSVVGSSTAAQIISFSESGKIVKWYVFQSVRILLVLSA